MDIDSMTREQVLEAVAQTEAELRDAENWTAKRDACRERLIHLKARLVELEGSQGGAARALVAAGVKTSQQDVSNSVRAVLEAERTGEPVVAVMRKIEHPSTSTSSASKPKTPAAERERSAEYVALAWQNVAAAVGEVLKLGPEKLTPKVRRAVLAQLREAVTRLEAGQ